MSISPASVTADMAAFAIAASSARGGLPAAWRDLRQLLSDRCVTVDTEAQTPTGKQIVLRTQVRLTGDVQTDILRGWLSGTPVEAANKVLDAHFQSVNEAVRGWSAIGAAVRLGSLLTFALGMIPVASSIIQRVLHGEWQTLIRLLLTNWWALSGIVIAALSLLLRWALRLWIQWKFHRGLEPGASQ